MLVIGLDCTGSLYTFNKDQKQSGEASNNAFALLDLGQLPRQFFSCVDSLVSDSRNANLNLFSFNSKKKIPGQTNPVEAGLY